MSTHLCPPGHYVLRCLKVCDDDPGLAERAHEELDYGRVLGQCQDQKRLMSAITEDLTSLTVCAATQVYNSGRSVCHFLKEGKSPRTFWILCITLVMIFRITIFHVEFLRTLLHYTVFHE
jgi:hypothetical protein